MPESAPGEAAGVGAGDEVGGHGIAPSVSPRRGIPPADTCPLRGQRAHSMPLRWNHLRTGVSRLDNQA